MHSDAATLDVPLTPREIDVLRLIAHGCTYRQVAEQLGVSLHTVATHIKNLYRKLGVRSGAAAVMRAVTMRVLGVGGSTPSAGTTKPSPHGARGGV